MISKYINKLFFLWCWLYRKFHSRELEKIMKIVNEELKQEQKYFDYIASIE